MSAEKKYTEREMVYAQREAFFVARQYCSSADVGEIALQAAAQYPLPKVKRTREVQDPDPEFSQRWRVVGGIIQHDAGSGGTRWQDAFTPPRPIAPNFVCFPTPERITLWADLLARPFEEVEVPA